MLYEGRYGLNFNNNPLHGPVQGKQLVDELGLKGLTPDLPDWYGILNLNFDGIPIQGLWQDAQASPGNSQFAHLTQQSLSWFKGRHDIKAGFAFTYVDWAEQAANDNLFGNITFSDRFTRFPIRGFPAGYSPPYMLPVRPAPLFNSTWSSEGVRLLISRTTSIVTMVGWAAHDSRESPAGNPRTGTQ